MTKRLYLDLFFSLFILLIGYYFSSYLTNIWLSRITNVLSIIFAGLYLINFNPSLLPEKEKSTFKIQYLLPIIIGIIGLILVSNFITLLIFNLMEWELYHQLRPSKSELPIYLILLFVWVFLEEVYFRRVITQMIFNKKGLNKAIWISSLIFSVAHVLSENGLFMAFIGGVILGYIYLKTKNIWLSIATHLTVNLSNFLLAPKLTEYLTDFNSSKKISLVIILGFGMIIYMILILRKQTNK